VRPLLGLFEIARVNRGILGAALDGSFSDFEDAVTHEAARQITAFRRRLARLAAADVQC
jgi:hypothetical protein